MSARNLVIVESPAKASTINKYLGPDYEVLASYGHVRDLPAKDGSVEPDNDFRMHWEQSDRGAKTMKEIAQKAKGAEAVYLATDPDREGEAISWHVKEILQDKKLADQLAIHRVTFNEITKSAVQNAFKQARELDDHLIQAYLARRALDYLVGFNLSPILWRKLPGSKSAGRVQSVALRLICEREAEIEGFTPQEYWTVQARLKTPQGAAFAAKLTHLAGNKLGKLDLDNEEAANTAVNRIKNKSLSVQQVEKKQTRRNPNPPFITSTLQQEASRKLGFSASQTMRTAQQLYEGVTIGGETVGLITYMRTDGTTLSDEAVKQARSVIGKEYGDSYVPQKPRHFTAKAKNAQEAHEAIRPTDLSRTPDQIKSYLDERQAKLYELIWKRTMASQMEAAVLDQMAVTISDGTDDVVLRATGSVVTFDGYLKLYRADVDEPEEDSGDSNELPPMQEGDGLKQDKVEPEQHFTKPPPRYTEASLVKKLEEMGIGRPSTYAAILQVLQDRDYVRLEKKRFVPEDRGRVVTAFLRKFFARYVDYDFTANMEDELDAIASGHMSWRQALQDFWQDFSKAVEEAKGLSITDVINHLDNDLGPHFFPAREDGADPRACPSCDDGFLSLKLGKFGAFIGCSNYPDCRYTKPLAVQDETEQEEDSGDAGPQELGTDPETGKTVSLRKGPYGPYVQLDEPEGSKTKPKRQGLPKGVSPADMDFDKALKLLSLPRDVGQHPETGEMIQAGIGRFGPYVRHKKTYASIPKGEDVHEIGLNRAVDLIAQKDEKQVRGNSKDGNNKSTGKKGGNRKKSGDQKKDKSANAAQKN